MKRWLLVCMTVVVVLGSSAALVWADDLRPPPWQRGADLTTYQNWDFKTNTNPTPPEFFFNPYGVPGATVTDGTWSLFFDNHVGSWNLGSTNSSIDLLIPNAPGRTQFAKQVWTQITWQGVLPSISVDGQAATLVETLALPGTNWSSSSWMTTLPNTPTSETLHIAGLTHVGEVVVDTQSVPEPSTVVLLSTGAIGLAIVLWRRNRVA